MAGMHLIRFAKPEDRQRAIMVFLDVPATRLVLPGHDMVVMNAHIDALERENIPFEYLSKTQRNGTGPAAVQP
jgi:hypothetical protein